MLNFIQLELQQHFSINCQSIENSSLQAEEEMSRGTISRKRVHFSVVAGATQQVFLLSVNLF